MANDIVFVDGLKVKERFEGLLGVSIRVENFKKFIEEYENNGYVNIDICKSKDKNSWYARLNTWKPENKTNTKSQKEIIKSEFDGEELIGDEEIPF